MDPEWQAMIEAQMLVADLGWAVTAWSDYVVGQRTCDAPDTIKPFLIELIGSTCRYLANPRTIRPAFAARWDF